MAIDEIKKNEMRSEIIDSVNLYSFTTFENDIIKISKDNDVLCEIMCSFKQVKKGEFVYLDFKYLRKINKLHMIEDEYLQKGYITQNLSKLLKFLGGKYLINGN